MPIFEYRCQSCEAHFEKLVRTPADTPEVCPQCREPQLKKLFSSFSPSVAQSAPACASAGQCPATAGGGGGCCGGGGGCPL